VVPFVEGQGVARKKDVRMGDVNLISVVDKGLGNSAYLLDLGDGRALAVDASRDLRALRASAEGGSLKIAYAADTHLHADFLTGALQLASADGAQVLASAEGHREYPHTGLADGDEVGSRWVNAQSPCYSWPHA
jgi:glyoxylase-like metal-dependent hydrolase (beta-lactamase superfamily II)